MLFQLFIWRRRGEASLMPRLQCVYNLRFWVCIVTIYATSLFRFYVLRSCPVPPLSLDSSGMSSSLNVTHLAYDRAP